MGIDVDLSRGILSKEDYANFTLYQANQKAYEATRLKQFVEHALHTDQINRCFDGEGNFRSNLDSYMALVTSNVSQIANEIVWNTHHRAINMFANDGRVGAQFLDVHSLDHGIFADFEPCDTSQAMQKVTESWHHASPKPNMVWLSASNYPIVPHSHLFEDIDDIGNALFSMDTFENTLPVGRGIKLPRQKERHQDMPGASYQEKQPTTSQGNRLAFPAVEQPFSPHRILEPNQVIPITKKPGSDEETDRFLDVENEQPQEYSPTSFVHSLANSHRSNVIPTQLEMMFERHGGNALNSNCAESTVETKSCSNSITVPSWPVRLLDDHQRRLNERWGGPPKAPELAPLSFRHALDKATAMGFRPTESDWHEKMDVIERRERRRGEKHIFLGHDKDTAIASMHTSKAESSHSNHELYRITRNVPSSQIVSTELLHGPRKKKRKMNAPVTRAVSTKSPVSQNNSSYRSASSGEKPAAVPASVEPTPLPPHPSGSTTLEPDQTLPPQAYFEPKSPGEERAWRCNIKHAMGHYYNAGDRKACRGCNTSLMEMPKVKRMDFYLPRRSLFFQPAVNMCWKPNRPPRKGRKSNRSCHNSIAKDAFWTAINHGATQDQARQAGCDAVVDFLRPKPRKVPTPKPTPEPEPNLGPHPSGSKTMEHGQDLPDCAYATKQDLREELAWRCDVNHALGRYYLAGDRKSCPGCGSNKGGLGRQTVMDYYMPPGVILRQEAPSLVKWKPRKNKSHTSGRTRAANITNTKSRVFTHNQICTEKYFAAKAEGYSDDEALLRAIQQTDAYLDDRQDESARKYEYDDDEDQDEHMEASIADSSPASSNSYVYCSMPEASSTCTPTIHAGTDMTHTSSYGRNLLGDCTVSLVPMKRASEDGSGDELDSLFEDRHDVPVYPERSGAMSASAEESEAQDESEGSDSE